MTARIEQLSQQVSSQSQVLLSKSKDISFEVVDKLMENFMQDMVAKVRSCYIIVVEI